MSVRNIPTVVQLFTGFSTVALSGFGGVLPIARRTLVEKRGWLDEAEFVELLSLGQLLPGPNIVNLAVMLGDRRRGLPGALAALAGLLAGPLLVVLSLAMLHQRYGHLLVVQKAIAGMAAVACGLLVAMGVKMAWAHPKNPRTIGVTLLAMAAIAGLGWPLIQVLAELAPIALLWAAREER